MVNNSLAAADPTSTLLRLRAIGVLPQIDKVKKEHGTRLAIVPMLPTEPVGIPALEALSRTRVALTRWDPRCALKVTRSTIPNCDADAALCAPCIPGS